MRVPRVLRAQNAYSDLPGPSGPRVRPHGRTRSTAALKCNCCSAALSPHEDSRVTQNSFYINLYVFLPLICPRQVNFQAHPGTLRGPRKTFPSPTLINSNLQLMGILGSIMNELTRLPVQLKEGVVRKGKCGPKVKATRKSPCLPEGCLFPPGMGSECVHPGSRFSNGPSLCNESRGQQV